MTGPFAIREAALIDADFAAIADAILAAYPDKDVLYDLLLREWGVRVADDIHVARAGKLVVSDLVEWARAQGRALDLLAVTWADREREYRLLKDLARLWLDVPGDPQADPSGALAAHPKAPIDIASGSDPVTGSPVRAEKRSYKARTPGRGSSANPPLSPAGASPVIRRSADPPNSEEASAAVPDRKALVALRGALCIVSVDNQPTATGFLIGRHSVLTTHSAVGHAIAQGLTGDRIRLGFAGDDQRLPLDLTAAAGTGWIGPHSAAAETEMTARPPTADTERQLDFAVIRLADPAPPTLPILCLPTHVPIVPPGDEMVVLHHPMGGAVKISTGRLIGYSRAGARVTYEAETAPGSAGAPVFTAEGDLIAMHHAAARSEGTFKIGQGVPIWRIRQAIVDAGLDPAAL